MRNRVIIPIIALSVAVIVLGGFAIVWAQSFPKVLDEYVLEAGDDLPRASSFLVAAGGSSFSASFSDKINKSNKGYG